MNNLGLEEVKAIAADILKRVDETCRENGLKYFVLYGTLLGTVRHKGFIPWDDDIDIVMPREDYNKLEEIVRYDKYLRFITIDNTADTIYPHGKMIDIRTELYVHGYRHVAGYGIGIDIFPLDYMSNDEKKRNRSIKYALILRKIIEHSASITIAKNGNLRRQLARYFIYGITRFVNTQKIIRILDRLNINNEKSNYMGVAWDAALPVDKLFEPVDLDFNDFKVMAPKEYDYILRLKFNDYMKLPPKEEQIPKHHYDCWIKREYQKDFEQLFTCKGEKSDG